MKYIALFLLISASAAAQSVTLTLPSVAAAPGSTAYLKLQLHAVSGSAPASLEWSLDAPAPEVQRISFSLGAAAAAASKLLCCSGNKCVLAGPNSSAIANGTVAVLAVQLSKSAQGNLAIQFSYARAASAAAVDLSTGTGSGEVAITGVLTSMVRPTAPWVVWDGGGEPRGSALFTRMVWPRKRRKLKHASELFACGSECRKFIAFAKISGTLLRRGNMCHRCVHDGCDLRRNQPT